MDVSPETLPDDASVLRQMVLELLETLRKSQSENQLLQQRLMQLLRHQYGSRSEKLDPNQLALFEELTKSASSDTSPEAQKSSSKPEKTRKGHGRRKLPRNLPRKRIEHDLPDDEKVCKCCEKELMKIGEETSEQLDYIPASLVVLEHVRAKYACKHCEGSVVTADKPNQPIEKGLPGSGLLAHVVTSKYCDHLPLHRMEAMLERHGVRLHRSTMCGWMRQSAELLFPLYELMIRRVLRSGSIHTDDTPTRVLDRTLKKTRQGRFWVYVGDNDHPYTTYDYTPDRRRAGPETFLGDYEGYMHADAFGGYDGIYAGGNVTEVMCWAHARRKFFDARDSDSTRALAALAWIRKLYRVERDARQQFESQKDESGAKTLSAIRQTLRRAQVKPLLADFKTWLAEQADGVLPKSPMGKAINYVLGNWDALCRYADNGDLDVDNNAAERALRGIAVGRKNWLFAGSDNGGRTAAVLLSLVESAKRHRRDPFAYLRDVISRISDHPHNRLADLLPDRLSSGSGT